MLWAGLHIFSSTQPHSFCFVKAPLSPTHSRDFFRVLQLNAVSALNWGVTSDLQLTGWTIASVCVLCPPPVQDTHPGPCGFWIKSHVVSTHRSTCSQSRHRVSLTSPWRSFIILNWAAKNSAVTHTLCACMCVCVFIPFDYKGSQLSHNPQIIEDSYSYSGIYCHKWLTKFYSILVIVNFFWLVWLRHSIILRWREKYEI